MVHYRVLVLMTSDNTLHSPLNAMYTDKGQPDITNVMIDLAWVKMKGRDME